MTRGFAGRAARSGPVVNLWFLLVVFLLLATSFVALILYRWFTELSTKFNALANLECQVAVSAFDSGGPQKLESVMRRHEAESGVRAYLFDENGRNLGGGPDRPSLLLETPLYLRVIVRLEGKRSYVLKGRVVPQASNHACVVVTPDLEDVRVFGDRAVILLAILAALCYGTAGYVVLRMRRLETVIRSFGTGKLEVRLPSDSRDPIRHLSESFNQMADQVESLVDAHKRLCIDVSHELRSPLTRLRLAIGLARTGTHGALDQIELESTRLNDLVEQLLDVARAEVDPTAFRREAIDVEALLTEVLDVCSIEARKQDCELSLHMENPGLVFGDPELLRRALENPVRNAIHHSPVGSRVEVRCSGNEELAVISVRDMGPGVPIAALQEIFRPFYRVETDRGRSTGGSGLGLAIVQRAVVLHRGSVRAENSAPGLRIEICLPRQ